MTKYIIIAFVLGFAASALAQSQPSPEQNVAAQLGSQLGLCLHGTALMQTELQKAQAEIRRLKDKYEPASPAPSSPPQH